MDDFELEIKKDFLVEALDLLIKAENAFMRLESERENPALIDEIFRLAHNLKGTSKAVGFDQLSGFTHVAENLILKIKEKVIPVNNTVISVLLAFNDRVNEMVRGLNEDISREFDVNDIKEKLIEVTSGTFKQEVVPQEVVIEPSVQAVAAIEETVVESPVIENLNTDISVEQTQPIKSKKAATTAASSEDDTIRVKLSRIDKLNNMMGELIIMQTVLDQRRYIHIQDEIANKSIAQMGKLFKEVQEISISLRMLSLKSTFQKLSRIVRDTSSALDKKVNLQIIGEDTDVDKTVLEQLGDPLVHIVRNAIDHGLESKEDRLKANKSIEGVVEINAFHEGSNLVIQITDDGKGINPEVIRKKAIEKNIITPDIRMSDTEIINLIFHPGFSTKEQVTEVSGRGVGMDVVKTNIQNLGGEVVIQSKVGIGSNFRITLPLTMAIIDGMVINSRENLYVLPLNQIHELIRADQKDIHHLSSAGSFLNLRGETIPFFQLSQKLGLNKVDISQSIILIVRSGKYPFGIQIDDVSHRQQIVIKPLGKELEKNSGFMGSAILPNGKPALILDLVELFIDDLKQSKAYSKLKEVS
ncbi:MAG: chemotaxis protein CheA [Bacteriovoracaceae bacterium]